MGLPNSAEAPACGEIIRVHVNRKPGQSRSSMPVPEKRKATGIKRLKVQSGLNPIYVPRRKKHFLSITSCACVSQCSLVEPCCTVVAKSQCSTAILNV